MMQFLKQNKLLSLGGLVVLLGALMYFMFFSSSAPEGAVVSQSESDTVTRDLIVTLSNLNTIRLDDSIFTNEVFVSLSDFGVQIPPQNVGRRNPFAPI